MTTRPQGIPVRVTLVAADKEIAERAMRRLKRADPNIALSQVRQTQTGTWAAMGTIFVAQEDSKP